MSIRGRLLYIGVVGILFGALYRLVRAEQTAQLDHDATVALQRRQHPAFARLMHLVSWPGFPPQSRIIPWSLPVAFLVTGHRRLAVFQLLGWGTGFFSFVVKRRVKRPRPSHEQIRVAEARIGGTSFPSGHVINYIGVYGTLAYLARTRLRPGPLRTLAVGGLSGLIALVGPSRIYLGHHFLTDVLASYLLGSGYLVGLVGVGRWIARKLPR